MFRANNLEHARQHAKPGEYIMYQNGLYHPSAWAVMSHDETLSKPITGSTLDWFTYERVEPLTQEELDKIAEYMHDEFKHLTKLVGLTRIDSAIKEIKSTHTEAGVYLHKQHLAAGEYIFDEDVLDIVNIEVESPLYELIRETQHMIFNYHRN